MGHALSQIEVELISCSQKRFSMGFPCSSYVMMLPKPLVFFLLLLDCFIFSFSYILHVLGLKPYPHASLIPPWHDYTLYLQATSTNLQPHPPHPASASPTSASAVTETLRIVQFDIFAKNKREAAAAEAAVCAVCLAEFAGEHKVRELGNCDHAFHTKCIDRWAETGQATCPLCRSPLLPTSPQPQSWEKPGRVWFRRYHASC